MYIAAKSISIKKGQDRYYYDAERIILCDGIGEFPNSDKAAEITVSNLEFMCDRPSIKGSIENATREIHMENITGGTTFIGAYHNSENKDSLLLSYVGNGAIFHLPGNFGELPKTFSNSNLPYRYSNILIPHVDGNGTLSKHISHHSNPKDWLPTFIEVTLNNTEGDIFILCTDGISSLEEDVLLRDEEQRTWRFQSSLITTFVQDLHKWLVDNCEGNIIDLMDDFLERYLGQLKMDGKLEDDASIGLLITQAVIDYYKQCQE